VTTTGRHTKPAIAIRTWATAAAATALFSLLVALVLGGGDSGGVVPGLSDPGVITRWGQPIAKVAVDAAAAVTVGLLLLAVIIPASKRQLTADSLRALRAATWTSLVWAAATVVVHLLTLSDIVGEPLHLALRGTAFSSFTFSVDLGQAYAAVVLMTLTLIPATRLTVGQGGAIALLCLALAAALSPALVAHNASGDYHDTGTIASVVHVCAMALWVGGLIAVSWYAARRGRFLTNAASTFSSVALGCYVMLATSGVIYAWINLSAVSDLFMSSYGLILSAKIIALVALGYVGYRHRQHTLTLLRSGNRNVFRRLAGGEVVIMAAALGLAVSLTRTDPPVPDDIALISPVRALIGYPIPPEVSPWNLLTKIYPEAMTALICVAGAGLYIGGLLRLRKRGDSWPVGRTISWFLGLGTLAFVQMSGLMTYGMTMMSVHMVQHMMLMMVVPVMLVLGGPITLALRALKPAARGEIGPREMITSVLQSPFARFMTNPIVVFVLFASGSFMVYYTNLFEAAMRNHLGHTLMGLHFLIVGYLFFEVIIGIDPLPKRPPHLARVMLQLLAMGAHAVFGLGLTESAELVAGDYYRELATEITWLPNALDDQILAGQITMGFGELPGLVVIAVIFVQWYRSDEREARRFDRRESAAEAERQAYNAYLADLDAKAKAADNQR
jgi:putative copper resistance protein D